MLGGIDYERSTWTEKGTGSCSYDCAVLKFNCCCRYSGKFFSFACGNCGSSVLGCKLCLLEYKGYLVDFVFVVSFLCEVAKSVVITSDYLFPCSIAAYVFVIHTETDHIDSHICRGLVRTFSIDAFKQCVKDWEYLDVSIVAGCNGSVCFKMERVDHVYVVKVCSSSFVCNVYGMLQREIPHRECFELCISGLDTSLVFMIELA